MSRDDSFTSFRRLLCVFCLHFYSKNFNRKLTTIDGTKLSYRLWNEASNTTCDKQKMLGAAALARDAAAGLGMAVEERAPEGPARFQSAPNAEFGRLIKYEEEAAAAAPNFVELVRPLTMRGTVQGGSSDS